MTRRQVLLSTLAATVPTVLPHLVEQDPFSETSMPQPPTDSSPLDVVVVGGSFAGLSAALSLGRARRRVLILDGGEPRNRFSAHSNGFLTRDHTPPKEILASAREQLAKYPTVRFASAKAQRAQREEGRFMIYTDKERFQSRRLILAHGVSDTLPEVEGLRELWGGAVFHCPYCHAYELRDLPLAVLGAGEMAVHQAVLLRDWSPDVLVFANGGEFTDAQRERLKARGVPIEAAPVARLAAEGDELREVVLADGRRIVRRGMLVRTQVHPNGTFHEDLGLRLADAPNGKVIEINSRHETSVPGVFAAGDAGQAMHSVALAVSAGAVSGAFAHQSLIAENYP